MRVEVQPAVIVTKGTYRSVGCTIRLDRHQSGCLFLIQERLYFFWLHSATEETLAEWSCFADSGVQNSLRKLLTMELLVS
jgi:hypothetical protein